MNFICEIKGTLYGLEAVRQIVSRDLVNGLILRRRLVNRVRESASLVFMRPIIVEISACSCMRSKAPPQYEIIHVCARNSDVAATQTAHMKTVLP